jgi:hypothetical protein
MPGTSDPLLTAAKKWTKRISVGTNAGLNPAAIAAVQHADLSKVGAGGSGMSDQEALAAIQSAATGKTSQTKAPSTSLMGIPGRMVADAGSMLSGLAIGAAHVVEHPVRDITGIGRGVGETVHEALGNPSAAWDSAHGYEHNTGGNVASNLGSAFRNFAKTPVGRFVPGMTTIGQTTDPAGRKQMAEHPGFVAGDLLPEAHGIIKSLAAMGALGDVAVKGSAAEAAAKGQVAKSTVRAASEGLQKLSGGRLGLGVPTLRRVLGEYGATRLASQAIGQLHDWAKNLSATDKTQAWDLHIATHDTFKQLSEAPFTDTATQAAHPQIRADWKDKLGELDQAATAARAQLEEYGKGVEVAPVDHPAEATFPHPQTWHEVSAWIRDGNYRLSRSAPEGWYLKPPEGATAAPGSPAEVLVPRKGYEAKPITIPPDPRKLGRLQAGSAAAAQALEEHKAQEPPKLPYGPHPDQAPPMSPAQETLKKVWESGGAEGPDPALLRALPEEQQQLLRRAATNQGKLLALNSWAEMGIAKTAVDIEGHAMTLDPILRDRYFNSFTHFDPLEQMGLSYLKNHPQVLEAVPHLNTPGIDLAHGYSLPTDVYNALFRDQGPARGVLVDRPTPGTLAKASAKGVRIFKGSLFLRPSMVANIAVRGLIQAVGKEGPELFKPSTIRESFNMARASDPTVIANWRNLSTDQAHGLLAGSTLGRIVSEIPHAMSRATSFVSGVQRAMVFITEHDSMVKAGADESTARMAGMAAIRETFNTMDSMTPIEQTIIRQIFPFYGYQKMLFNYLSSFPADHPFVTETMSKIGQQETALNGSGLPQTVQQMLFIGNPDQNGNVKAVDVRSFNPFRSFANDLTLAGFTANLNPALKVLLQGVGVKTSTGTPELYPGLTYDPQTGSLVAKRPGIGITQALEAAVPQLATVDAMLGFNNRLKALKTSDPSAYRAYLFQTVGIPTPQTVNLPQQTAKSEEALYRLSSSAASSFIKTGDYGTIAGFNLIPYQSRWWTPEQLLEWRRAQAATISTAKQQPSGTSLKALLTPLPRTTAQLPPQG